MSSTDLPDRPAFQTIEQPQVDLPPISRLAVASLTAGVLSLLCGLSTLLLPLAILACGLSIVVVWKLSRDDGVGGIRMAQAGVLLATLSIAWSLTAAGGQERYYYSQAAEKAKVFLDVLASGKKYEALELRRFENERQLTGTNLPAFYSLQRDAEADETQAFLNAPVTQAVLESGPQADWQFSRGISVVYPGRQLLRITVQMVNRASKSGLNTVNVTMNRQLGLLTDESQKTTALWCVASLERP